MPSVLDTCQTLDHPVAVSAFAKRLGYLVGGRVVFSRFLDRSGPEPTCQKRFNLIGDFKTVLAQGIDGIKHAMT